jgi:uncharacterized protein YrzB (UPF0473 family)
MGLRQYNVAYKEDDRDIRFTEGGVTMGYRGVVKDHVVVLEEGVEIQEGTQVEVTPIKESARGSPAALLEVWGSDVPEEAWDVVERVVEELDRADREHEGRKPHA